MIVLRQLCRNRNTISTVRNAPSTIVSLTRLTALLDVLGASRYVTRNFDVGGRRSFSAATAAFTPRPVSTMFASCAFWMSSVIDGPAVDPRDRVLISFSPSMTSATCDRYTGTAALLRDDDPAELLGILDLAFDRARPSRSGRA